MQQIYDGNVHVPLERTFHRLTPTGDEEDPWTGHSSLGSIAWSDLLTKRRVLLLSEAGSGKTREVDYAARELNAQEKIAFFLRLEFVKDAFEEAFEVGSHDQFQEWLASSSEAWLFLDSIDEAKLGSPLDFQLAIRKIGVKIAKARDRVRIVLTGRVFAWQPTTDLIFCQNHLGYAPHSNTAGELNELGNATTKLADTEPGQSDTPVFEVFALDDLSPEQVSKLAFARGIDDVDAFVAAIERADAWSFASRPQDLQELSDFWLDYRRIGTRSEIVSNNVTRRLLERDPIRAQARPLSMDKARKGASQLAAATTLMQMQTIRVSDAAGGLPGIDVREMLTDWDDVEQQTLLSRPIFDAPIYAAQRFHHRSVREYLCAEWFAGLLRNHTSRRNIESLFFKSQYGIDIVVPALRPILPWLILFDERILEHVRLVAPEIVFEGGDPAALPVEVRRQILREVCEQMAGGSVGRSMRDIAAVQRFAGPDLVDEIRALLRLYADSADLRAFLLRMIWIGEIKALRLDALGIALKSNLENYERMTAIRAVGAVGTPDDIAQLRKAFIGEDGPLSREWLSEIIDCSDVSADVVSWLGACLEKVAVIPKHSPDHLPASLEKFISKASADLLFQFATTFDNLLSVPPVVDRRFCQISVAFEWLLEPATLLMKRMVDERNPVIFEDESLSLLRRLSSGHSYGRNRTDDRVPLIEAAIRAWPELNRKLFWFEVQEGRRETLKREKERLTHYWPALFRSFSKFSADDFEYIAGQIGERIEPDDRLVALSLAFDLYRENGRSRTWRKRLHTMVADEPALQERLALYFKPPGKSAAERQHVAWAARWKKQDAERTRKESENEASWRDGLRNGLAKERAALLKYPGQVTNAVYYLYHRSRGDEMKAGRWTEYNWQELAEEFGMEVARFYRDATVGFWRQYQPKLRSEGAPGNTTTNATIIGLVGLEIEAIETQVGRPHLRLVRLRWLADMPVANSTAFQRGFPPCSRRFLNS